MSGEAFLVSLNKDQVFPFNGISGLVLVSSDGSGVSPVGWFTGTLDGSESSGWFSALRSAKSVGEEEIFWVFVDAASNWSLEFFFCFVVGVTAKTASLARVDNTSGDLDEFTVGDNSKSFQRHLNDNIVSHGSVVNGLEEDLDGEKLQFSVKDDGLAGLNGVLLAINLNINLFTLSGWRGNKNLMSSDKDLDQFLVSGLLVDENSESFLFTAVHGENVFTGDNGFSVGDIVESSDMVFHQSASLI